jgi:hypothetical protein
MNTCSSCGQTKSVEFFSKASPSKCLVCYGGLDKSSKFSSAWWREKFSEEELQVFSKLKLLCTKAKLRQQDFDLDIDWEYLFDIWVEQDGKCAYSGVPLSIEANHPFTISLDRKDSSVGYQKGNLQLLAWSVNKMKQDLPEDLFLDLCFKITDNLSKKTT